jgi:type VI secretion system protein ImpE
MPSAAELYRSGELDAALAAAVDAVKTRPMDLDARCLLVDLLCFDGQIERADKQLEAMEKLDGSLARGVQLYRQILRGELARKEVFEAGRVPELLSPPDATVEHLLRGLVGLREARGAEALAAYSAAESDRPKCAGTAGTAAFSDMRDLDDRFAGIVELIAADGRYLWCRSDELAQVSFPPPACVRDLIWRAADITLRDGREGQFFMPVLYPSPPNATAALKLGRETAWSGDDQSPITGAGQRVFLIDEADEGILALTVLDFAGNE